MAETLGQKIEEARKRRGMKQDELGLLLNLSKSSISKIENDELKGGPDPETVVRTAAILRDDSILFFYLESNPVYSAVLPKVFPDLNRIRTEPAVIFTKVAHEAEEAKEAAMILSEIFMRPEPRTMPGFDGIFKAKMEQLLDVKRAVEILEFQLLAAEIMTKEMLQDIYDSQQAKCEDRGYHKPEQKSVSPEE
ncbi:MAG: helix-turn-helix transcriptional regulator [Bacteroidota bacterium]